MPPNDPRPAKPGPRARTVAPGTRSSELRPNPGGPTAAQPGKAPTRSIPTNPGSQTASQPPTRSIPETTPGQVAAQPGKPRATTTRTGATTQKPPTRPPPQPPQPIGPGSVIEGRYRLEQALGSGGMSTVYRATHTRTGGKLAIKLLDPRLSSKTDMQQRCIQEARAMMDIASNHVVRAYDVGTTPTGQVYIAMEYLEGEDLDHLLQREGPLPWERVAAMALQICGGLSSAHNKGTFHRDIKPQNCFRITLDRNPDHIKLIDFGIAKDTTNQKELTQDGVLLGTPEYMAPELIAPNAVPDARTDLYAVGASVYKLLTGTTPFASKNILDLLYHQKHSIPDAPSARAPDRGIPPIADQIVLRCLEKDPAQRFQSADDLAQAILDAFDGPLLPAGRARTMPVILPPGAVQRSGTTPIATPNPGVTPNGTRVPAEAEASTLAGAAPVRDETQPSQPIVDDLRPIQLKDVAMRGGTLLSLAVLFGLASFAAAPPPAEHALAAEPEPVAAEPLPPAPVPADSAAAPPDPVPADSAAAPPEPVPGDSAAKPPEPAPGDSAAAPPEPVPGDSAAKPPEPTPADTDGAAKPPEPAPSDSAGATPPPEPAPSDSAGATPPPEPPPADTGGAARPPEPAAPDGAPQPDPDFGYRSAEKELRDQHKFLQTCLDSADLGQAKLKFSIEVRRSGIPPHKIKVFSSNSGVRDCVKGLFNEFPFDSSPRGGAFAYTYQNGRGALERLPLSTPSK